MDEQLGYGGKYFHFGADYSGPQQQLVTIKKFPVTFKNNKLKSRRVYFTSYFDWIGEIREFSLLPILRQLADIVETKEWGVATNNVLLDIHGELRGGDIVEARLWLGRRLNDNVFDLDLEFRKLDGNNIEKVATATQRVSWVKILGHGMARVNRLPLFLEDIMQKMSSKSDNPSAAQSLNEPYSPLQKNCNIPTTGNILQIFRNALYVQNKIQFGELAKNFSDKKHFLKELKIQTTLEESNLVGNVYFANYPIWIGRVTDYFFYSIWPELYTHDDINNEFVSIQCKIDHLNEAMPFDSISVRMYLSKLFVNGLVLRYEVFSNNEKKIAIATQSLIWIKRNQSFNPTVDKLPDHFINKILNLSNNYV